MKQYKLVDQKRPMWETMIPQDPTHHKRPRVSLWTLRIMNPRNRQTIPCVSVLNGIVGY